MFDKKSSYALNKKDPNAIVYSDAGRHIIRLTRKDFDTEAEFLKWKTWSDQDYHTEDKGDNVQASHNLPLDTVADCAAVTDGPEVIIERRFEKLTRERYTAEALIRVKGQITEKQFRRIWMRYVEGLDVETIAQREGKVHSSISESINRAKKKISAFFPKNPTQKP